MSPQQRQQRVSLGFMVLATVAILVGFWFTNANYNSIKDNQRGLQREVAARAAGQCQSLTKVKNAAFSLTTLTPEAGVTDPNTLARIRISNAAKLDARRKLAQALAC